MDERPEQAPTLAPLHKPRTPKPELQQLGQFEDAESVNYPASIVLEAVAACLEDPRNLTRRHCLDFMLTHLQLRHGRLTPGDRQAVVESVLRLTIRNDIGITSRVQQYLFGGPAEEALAEARRASVMPLVTAAFNKMFAQPPHPDTPSPLKILQNFLTSNDSLNHLLLAEISFSLMRWVFNFNDEGELLKGAARLV